MRAYPATLVRRFSSLVDLSFDDEASLATLPFDITSILQRQAILRAGEPSPTMYVILEGWAARYGIRANGSRRITGIMLPGDFCGIHALSGASLDHNIAALTNCKIGKIDGTIVADLAHASPAINRALWRAKLVEESILRTWLLNSDDAFQAVGHLLCELHVRACDVGLMQNGRCYIPLTQQDIANAVGITNVHTNRMLQKLRGEGLIEFQRGALFIPDQDALRKACDFTPAYLHPLEAA